MRKIYAVHITPYGVLLNGDAGQIHVVLHHDRHRLLADIRGHRCGHIFLIAVVAHIIADGEDLKGLLLRISVSRYKGVLIVLLGIFPDPETVPAAQIIHHLGGGGGPLLLLELIDGEMTVHVRQKTVELGSLHRIGITSVFVQNNFKVADQRIPVTLDHADQPVYGGVQVQIFHLTALIDVLYGDGMGQLIVSQEISVAVIDAAPAALDGTLPHDLHPEGFKILLPVDDLQVEYPVDKNRAHTHERHDNHKGSGCDRIDKIFP